MDSMYKAFEALSKRLDSLDVNIGRKLDLVNVHVKNASQRTTALEMQGMHFKSHICECIGPLFPLLILRSLKKLKIMNKTIGSLF